MIIYFNKKKFNLNVSYWKMFKTRTIQLSLKVHSHWTRKRNNSFDRQTIQRIEWPIRKRRRVRPRYTHARISPISVAFTRCKYGLNEGKKTNSQNLNEWDVVVLNTYV